MGENKEAFTQNVKRLAGELGASLVGVAPASRFTGAFPGHRPQDWVPGAQSVVVLGLAVLNALRDWSVWLEDSPLVPPENRQPLAQHYLYTTAAHDVLNQELDRMAMRLSLHLEERGYLSMFLPSQYSPRWEKVRKYVPSGRGLFSFRHAAVLSGLGEFGLNNVVVTPRYGPMIRWVAVITKAPLEADPLQQEKSCLGEECSLCLEACAGAIEMRDGVDPDAVWIEPPSRTDIELCLRTMPERYCYGRCVRVCPVGMERFEKPATE